MCQVRSILLCNYCTGFLNIAEAFIKLFEIARMSEKNMLKITFARKQWFCYIIACNT